MMWAAFYVMHQVAPAGGVAAVRPVLLMMSVLVVLGVELIQKLLLFQVLMQTILRLRLQWSVGRHQQWRSVKWTVEL